MADFVSPYVRQAAERASRIPSGTERFSRTQSRSMANAQWEKRMEPIRSWAYEIVRGLCFIAAIAATIYLWAHLPEWAL